jgi:hypothetical protein
LAVDHHRVARVVAALITDNHVGFVAQQVNDLCLAFIAPLNTYYDGTWHVG